MISTAAREIGIIYFLNKKKKTINTYSVYDERKSVFFRAKDQRAIYCIYDSNKLDTLAGPRKACGRGGTPRVFLFLNMCLPSIIYNTLVVHIIALIKKKTNSIYAD